MTTKVQEFKAFDQYRLGEVFTDGEVLSRAQGKLQQHIPLQGFSDRGGTHPPSDNGKFTSDDSSWIPWTRPTTRVGTECVSLHDSQAQGLQAEGSGAWMFNAMLPTTDEEIKEFEEKVQFAEDVVASLKANTPIKDCGAKVVEVAGRLGLGEDTPIRDYMAKAIVGLPPDVKTGRPGFTLPDAEGNDISSDVDAVKSMIYEVFNDDNTFLMNAIQPTSKNSQVVSHLHTMLVRVQQIVSRKGTLMQGR